MLHTGALKHLRPPSVRSARVFWVQAPAAELLPLPYHRLTLSSDARVMHDLRQGWPQKP